MPSPCGQFAECRDINGIPSCSCLPTYIGSPPNCRPECTRNSDCASTQACINQRCRDPCPGACGFNANCHVINHTPICQCALGLIGDPFVSCQAPPLPPPKLAEDPCNPSPCGPNTVCRDGQCECMSEYQGNPLIGCRPECILNTDCSSDKACIRQKCTDPCPGTCAPNAICEVHNHIPMCHCPEGMAGNAFALCQPIPTPVQTNPCQPSPCGPNSQCRVINHQAVCSCLPEFIGAPPSCRPECTSNAECALNRACLQQKCRDPCPGVCGVNAECTVINHSPICRCTHSYTGNPFVACSPIPSKIYLNISLKLVPYQLNHLQFFPNWMLHPRILVDPRLADPMQNVAL